MNNLARQIEEQEVILEGLDAQKNDLTEQIRVIKESSVFFQNDTEHVKDTTGEAGTSISRQEVQKFSHGFLSTIYDPPQDQGQFIQWREHMVGVFHGLTDYVISNLPPEKVIGSDTGLNEYEHYEDDDADNDGGFVCEEHSLACFPDAGAELNTAQEMKDAVAFPANKRTLGADIEFNDENFPDVSRARDAKHRVKDRGTTVSSQPAQAASSSNSGGKGKNVLRFDGSGSKGGNDV
jgi:hypothetical protein